MMEGSAAQAPAAEGPWNPGISSDLPAHLLPLSTIFRAENVYTRVDEALGWQELTGLELEELVIFRPQRLAVHELLVRVTGDISVPDGIRVEDLGINFRRITQTILERHIEPQMGDIVGAYEALRQSIARVIDAELARVRRPALDPRPSRVEERRKGWRRWFGGTPEPVVAVEQDWEREERVLKDWSARATSSAPPLAAAAYRALSRIVSAVRGRHGGLWGDAALLAPLVTGVACNEHGAAMIGEMIEPLILRAAAAEGYGLLPAQSKPVVMNTKGASAAGKSTMRPLQKRLAGEIGVQWSDFALISPDIWRKYLLDYGRLGDAYKYAGTFTGKELALVDQKLDRYMARKAERGGMSHLLIDRFRFDSFASDSDEAGSNLLTRFGHYIYMFFLITPPHLTVERSWKRGRDVGRYKAVDDLLAHNVEAYSGMPELFFTWALRTGKIVHFEFLDNSVAAGELPRTIAFGRNNEIDILDVKCMLDIDRYREVNLDARRPEDVYTNADAMPAERNAAFLAQCVRTVPVVNFAERESGRVYARVENAKLVWTDPPLLRAALADPETHAGLVAVVPSIVAASQGEAEMPRVLEPERFHTLGQWGARRLGDAKAG